MEWEEGWHAIEPLLFWSCLAGAVLALLVATWGLPGCGGSCNQGRKACNCDRIGK